MSNLIIFFHPIVKDRSYNLNVYVRVPQLWTIQFLYVFICDCLKGLVCLIAFISKWQKVNKILNRSFWIKKSGEERRRTIANEWTNDVCRAWHECTVNTIVKYATHVFHVQVKIKVHRKDTDGKNEWKERAQKKNSK